MIHYSKIFKLKNIEILDINKIALMKAKKFGATSVFQNYKDKKLINKLNNDFYDYIIDTTGSSKLINFILKFPIYTKFALCGVPQLNERIKLNSLKINYGLKLLGSYGGNFRPQKDLNRYLKHLIKTKFNFKEYVSKIYNLKNINKVVSDYKNNKKVGKALIKVTL